MNGFCFLILPNFSVALHPILINIFFASRRATPGIGATPSSSLSSPRRCRSSGALFFSYLGDEDETVRIDLSADPDVRKEIRPPQVRKTEQTFLGSLRKSPFDSTKQSKFFVGCMGKTYMFPKKSNLKAPNISIIPVKYK